MKKANTDQLNISKKSLIGLSLIVFVFFSPAPITLAQGIEDLLNEGSADDGVPNELELRENGFIFFDPGGEASASITREEQCTAIVNPGAPIEPGGGDTNVDPAWLQVWSEAGLAAGVDPRILGAVFAAEHAGNFTPITGDGGSAAQGGWRQPPSSSATGPFQILNATWDWIRTLDSSLPARTNRGPSDPRNNPLLASRGAAAYLAYMGAPVGMAPGSSSQEFERVLPAQYNPRTGGEEPWTVASVVGRYNQGPYWDGSSSVGVNRVFEYIDDGVAAYIFLGGGEQNTGGEVRSCGPGGPGGAGGPTVVNGYAFPIAGFQNQITMNTGWEFPCPNICHHDLTPAFDLAHARDNSSVGIPVYAVTTGEIFNYRTTYMGRAGCHSYQLRGDDGWHYWHGHTVSLDGIENGRRVQAGEQIAVIGENRCALDTYPHLHIDRGFPQGRNGGSDCCRDLAFVELINNLWRTLPIEGVL